MDPVRVQDVSSELDFDCPRLRIGHGRRHELKFLGRFGTPLGTPQGERIQSKRNGLGLTGVLGPFQRFASLLTTLGPLIGGAGLLLLAQVIVSVVMLVALT